MKKLLTAVCVLFIAAGLYAAGEKEKAAGPAVKFPEKPIEVTCLFGAGSAADLIARKFSDLAQPVLGRPLPVVNRTGGGQSIGYTHVKEQKPDGYSVIWTSNGLLTAYYQGNIEFKQESFRSIARISYEPVSIAVKYDAPWKNMEEFYRYIKENPGKVRIGNSGVGTFTHLAAAAIENASGSKMVHVPFGRGLAFASLLGGQIEASSQLPSEVMAQHEAKQVRILAVTSAERVSALPQVPTLKESKIPLEMILWRGLAVPKGTPDEVVKVLESAAKKVVESEDFKKFCDSMSIIPAFQAGAEFDKFIAEDDRLTGILMKLVGTSKR
jgi:tripartite-type tricarboxylate transporter receptor subunit TctC